MTRRETDGMKYDAVNNILDPRVGAFELYHDMVQEGARGGGMRR